MNTETVLHLMTIHTCAPLCKTIGGIYICLRNAVPHYKGECDSSVFCNTFGMGFESELS